MNEPRTDAPWYAEDSGLFGSEYLEEYEKILTPERTVEDIEFLERELSLAKGMRILDLACGHGRHTVELARRGYLMTGQDLNGFFLDKAKAAAQEASVDVRWVQSDMREVPFEGEFDVVVNLFTAFGYLESDDEDQKVLSQVARALKSGGRFLVDVINRDRIMREFRESDWSELRDQSVVLIKRKFDFTTSRMNERRLRIWKDGKRRDLSFPLRMYSLHELIRMTETAGLTYEKSFGNNDSSPPDFTSMRCVLVTRKV